jgi:Holliday junction resolvase-like predicted endonuclease
MRALGDPFEQRARRELERAGLSLLASNYSTRHGELDLVMRDGATVVFVEVRSCTQSRDRGESQSAEFARGWITLCA